MDAELLPLDHRSGMYSLVVRNIIFRNFGRVRPILQQFGIHAHPCRSRHVFVFQKVCSLIFVHLILPHQHAFIHIDHFFRRAFSQLHSLVQQYHPVAIFTDAAQIMADKENRFPHFLKFFKLVVTLRLEKYIAYRQRFIYDQNLGFNINCHGKRKPDKHTAGISLHRLVHIIADISKFQDSIHLFINLLFRKADHGTVQIYIFYSVIFHVKSCTKFQQCGNAPVYRHFPPGRIQHSGNDFQDRRFPGTIRTDDPHRFPLVNRQIYLI